MENDRRRGDSVDDGAATTADDGGDGAGREDVAGCSANDATGRAKDTTDSLKRCGRFMTIPSIRKKSPFINVVVFR